MKWPDSKILHGYFILLLCLFIFTMWGVNLSSLSEIDTEVPDETGREKDSVARTTTWNKKTLTIKPRPFLYFYLKELGYDVKTTTTLPPYVNTLLIVINPGKTMFPRYKRKISRWVKNGGHLLVHSTKTHPLTRMLGVYVQDEKHDWTEKKIQKLPVISDSEQIFARDHNMRVREGASLIPVFDGNSRRESVLQTFRGKGKIVITSNPALFEPAGLRKKDNLKFITRIIDRMSQQDSIYFYSGEPDRYMTVKIRSSAGRGKLHTRKIKKKYLSFWSLVKANPISWVLLQMIVAIALYFYSINHWFSRPLPVEDPAREKDNYLTGMSEIYMNSRLAREAAGKILKSFYASIRKKLVLGSEAGIEDIYCNLKINYPDRVNHLKSAVNKLEIFSKGGSDDNEELFKYVLRLEKIRKELKLYD